MLRNLDVKDLDIINYFLSELEALELTEKDLKNNIHNYIGYEIDGKIVGFIGYSIYIDRAEIDYIFVNYHYRLKKIASKMLQYVSNICLKSCYNITLEVKKSNKNAIAMYQKFGFKEIKTIKNYYKNEDGILMEVIL